MDAHFEHTGNEINMHALINSLHAPMRKRRFGASPVCLHDN